MDAYVRLGPVALAAAALPRRLGAERWERALAGSDAAVVLSDHGADRGGRARVPATRGQLVDQPRENADAPGGHLERRPECLGRPAGPPGATEHEQLRERGHGFVTVSVTDPFGNVLGIMSNPHYLDMLAARSS